MRGGRKYESKILEDVACPAILRKHFKISSSAMASVFEWTKHRNSSAFTVQVIRNATLFMPWSCKIPIVPGFVLGTKKYTEPNMCFSDSIKQDPVILSKSRCGLTSQVDNYESESPLIPGLPDDVAKYCFALVPRSNFPVMGGVCKRWRSFLQSKEFITVRKLAAMVEEWLYFLTTDSEGTKCQWEVFDCSGNKNQILPPMPGPVKAGFGVVVLDGKLLVMAGYSPLDGAGSASADVYQYESCLNKWSKLASMNVARYDFACAEVNGIVYVIGGCGVEGDNLSSAEVYDPERDEWSVIESLRRPRWGCFACGFEGKLYVMGGRSSFRIGNSKFIDVYNPVKQSWGEMKNGCVMVTAHAVVGKKLFCMEWKNQRRLASFNSDDTSWKMVTVPLGGSSRVGFRFGILKGKLLLFAVEEDPTYRTLLYDPNAAPGQEWHTCDIRPSGMCLWCATIKV